MLEINPIVIPASYTTETPKEFHVFFSSHTLLSKPKTPSSNMCCGVGVLPLGEGHFCAHHHTQAEIYSITEGEGIVTIDGVLYNVS